MPSHAPGLDPYVTTTQWSRRFLGLRLFLSLAAGGWATYAAHVEQAISLAELLGQRLEKIGWSVVNGPSLAVACVAPPPGALPVRDIVQRVVTSGSAWVSAARFEGRDVVRACVTHGETSPEDIMMVAEALEHASHS